MIPICSAQMPCKYRGHSRRSAFTLTEMIVVIVVVALGALLVQMSLLGLFRRHTFKGQVHEFVMTMQMTSRAVVQGGKRYEVIIDIDEQNYMLREISSSDMYADILEEEIIVQNDFSDNCWVDYVLFDDDEYTDSGRAKFRMGRSGWQNGGVIVLRDESDKAYSVIINRINRMVTLKEGEADILEPKDKSEMLY